MGELVTRKPSAIFTIEREIPHIRLKDENALESLYTLDEKVGEGTYGLVYKSTSVQTKEVVAIKVVNRDKAGGPGIKLLEREIGILKTVCHDNIIRLVEVCESPIKIFLVMEFCDRGELAKLSGHKPMPESTVKTVMERLAAAIAYLHINGIVHRDLKLENILVRTNPADLNDQFSIKVTDFGFSVMRDGMGPEHMLQSFCGTPAYMAPEIIQNRSYSESCDNWAIGCITFALLTGKLPFWHKEEEVLHDMITNNEPMWQVLPKDISKEAKECLHKLLSKNPANRMTAGELLRHPWITGVAGSDTPNVLDMMHAFHMNNIEDDADEDEGVKNADEIDRKPIKTPASRDSDSQTSSTGLKGNLDGSSREATNDIAVSNDGSSPVSSSSIQKSPSDHDLGSTLVKQKTPDVGKRKFDISLPASSNTKQMFSNPRNQNFSHTPRPANGSKTSHFAKSQPTSSSTSLRSSSGSSGAATTSSKHKKT